MIDADRFDRLRGLVHTGEIPIARHDCLDAEVIGALADGTLDPSARAPALAHLASCAYCRRAVASIAEALADGPVTHEIEMIDGRARSRRVRRFTVPLAAAAVLLLVLLRSPADAPDPIHRGGGVGNPGSAPTPTHPVGSVAGAALLAWQGMAGADRYRVTLFDTQGAVLYETETPDTTAALPASVRLVVGQSYLWKVAARTGWERWTTSELVQFTVARAPPP